MHGIKNIMAHQMLWDFVKKVRVTTRHTASVITGLTAIAVLSGCAASSRPSMQLRTSTRKELARRLRTFHKKRANPFLAPKALL
jgi:hypothetical protein